MIVLEFVLSEIKRGSWKKKGIWLMSLVIV